MQTLTPQVQVLRESSDSAVSIRAYDRAAVTESPAPPDGSDARIAWPYQVVAIDTLVDPFTGRTRVRIEASVGEHSRTAHVTISSGAHPISLRIGSKLDAAGRLPLDAVVHVVAANGLADVSLLLTDGGTMQAQRLDACFLDGNEIDLPCAVARYLDDAYILIQARVTPTWAALPRAEVHATILSQKGERHSVAWRVDR